MLGVLLPAVRVPGFDTQHLDAELVQRAFGVGHHLLRIGCHADRPFERNARLCQSADQVVNRLVRRLADRVVERGIDRGACHVVRRRHAIEQRVDSLDVENALADQARAADVLDHRDHGRVGVGHRMVWRQWPDLAVADDALGKNLDQDRLAEQRARRAGVVRVCRTPPLQAGLRSVTRIRSVRCACQSRPE